MEAARSLAKVLHANGIHLVYGGGTAGMMGELAKTMVALSGPQSVHGIIPRTYLSIERPEEPVELQKSEDGKKGWLERTMREFTKKKVNESALLSEEVYGKTTVVGDVQIRKKMMANQVDTGGTGSGFIGLSGGFGTMDELMEMVTWNQLGVHDRGVCLLNVDGFWDPLMSWMERSIDAGFVREDARRMFVAKETPEQCVQWLGEYSAGGQCGTL